MAKGGYREGSGRPVGTTGAYKTPEEKKKDGRTQSKFFIKTASLSFFLFYL